MNEYTVTMRISDRDQFLHFVETVGPVVDRLVVTVKATEDAAPVLQTPPKATVSVARRAPRGSKVNDTILQMLEGGNRTVKELKSALEAANLSAGSLSTGLAVLQREGRVMRIEDGVYGLAHPMGKAA